MEIDLRGAIEDEGYQVIGDEGAIRIAEGLEKNTSLKKFRLSLLTLYSTMKTNKTLAIFRHYVFTTFHNSNITSNNNLHTTR